MEKEELVYEPTDDPQIFQVTVLGELRRRQVTTLPNGESCMQGRRVEIALILDEGTGSLMTARYQPGKHPPIDDFPALSLEEAMLLRGQMQTGDIATVRKARGGASKQFLDIDPRRRDERVKIPKPSHSFTLKR